MPDEALVATLRLLFSNYTPGEIQGAILEATTLPPRDQRKLVCNTCGCDELWFNSSARWLPTHNRFDLGGDVERPCGDVERPWCKQCGGETQDQEVAHDYVHPDLRK